MKPEKKNNTKSVMDNAGMTQEKIQEIQQRIHDTKINAKEEKEKVKHISLTPRKKIEKQPSSGRSKKFQQSPEDIVEKD